MDPFIKEWESPYATFSDNPVWKIDPLGADPTEYKTEKGETIAKTNDGIDKQIKRASSSNT